MGFTRKSWLSFLVHLRQGKEADGPPLAILAFDAAKTMSRLASLHRALSEAEHRTLRTRVRSHAVAHLVSLDQVRLLRLACAELYLDLDYAAASVSRLAARCSSPWPRAFPHLYSDLKSSGLARPDRRFVLPTKKVDKHVRRMERYAAGAAELYAEMEVLAELEASERKQQRWKNFSGPLTPQLPPRGGDSLEKKLSSQQRLVRRLQESSLWSVGVEKATKIMARAVVTIFSRLCSVFSAFVPELPVMNYGRPRVHPNYSASGPLYSGVSGVMDEMGRSGPLFGGKVGKETGEWAAREMEPAEGTVGAAGLALRYAHVVGTAERMMYAPEVVGDEAKGELYAMLPVVLRTALAARRREVDGGEEAAARGREAARKVLGWLGPMAEDTARWHADKSCERQRVDTDAARVLAVQTLRFADRERTERAIAEVLVGLSCVMAYLHGKNEDSDHLQNLG